VRRHFRGCVVLRSVRHGDTFATTVDASGLESLMRGARDFADTLPWDDGESVRVGFSSATDPGVARLRRDIEWVACIATALPPAEDDESDTHNEFDAGGRL
jgi:hypothetical protein